MKKLFLKGHGLILILLTSLLMINLQSCKDNDDEYIYPSLTVQQLPADNLYYVDAQAGTLDIKFESNRPWTAQTNTSWLKVTPAKGEAGQQTLKLSFEENTGEPREAVVKLQAGAVKSISLTIQQKSENGKTITYVPLADVKQKVTTFPNDKTPHPLKMEGRLKVTITADGSEGGFFFSGYRFVQDENTGMVFTLAKGSKADYKIGDILSINLASANGSVYNGTPQLVVGSDAISVMENSPMAPKVITIAEVADPKYRDMLVKIENVQFKEYEGRTIGDPNHQKWTNHILQAKDGKEIQVQVYKTAQFAGEAVPEGSGSITAIMGAFKNNPVLSIFSKTNWDMKNPRFEVSGEAPTPVGPTGSATVKNIQERILALNPADKNARLSFTDDETIVATITADNSEKGITPFPSYVMQGPDGFALVLTQKKGDNGFNYHIGDKLQINLNQAQGKNFKGVPQLTQVAAKITVLENSPLTIPTLTIEQAKEKTNFLHFVMLNGVQFKEYAGKKYADNGLVLVDAQGNEFAVHVNASFKNNTVPQGSGSIKCLISTFGDTPQLLLLHQGDIQLNQPRFGEGSSPTPSPVEPTGNVTVQSIQEKILNLPSNPKDKKSFTSFNEEETIVATVTADNSDKGITPFPSYVIQGADGFALILTQKKGDNAFSFRIGDKLQIKLKGASGRNYWGTPQLTQVKDQITVLSNSPLEIPTLTIAQAKGKANFLHIVKLNGVQFKEYAGKKFGTSGSRLVDAQGDEIPTYVNSKASFVDNPLPQGSGSIIIMCSTYKGQPQARILHAADVQMDQARF